MYDTLIYKDAQGKFQPGVAESWSISKDELTWTFKIRKGIKFHNGDDLTAADVKFTLDRLTDPKTIHVVAGDVAAEIKSIDVVDTYTVAVNTKRPFGWFDLEFSDLMDYGIVPKNYFEKVGVDYFREHPIGSGPFKFVSRKKSENIKYEAIDSHWRQTSYYKDLEIRVVPEDSTRLAMLRQGQADIIDVPLSFKKEAQAANVRLITVPDMVTTQINFPVYVNPEKDPGYNANWPLMKKEVRMALNLAVNKDEIIKQVLAGEGRPQQLTVAMPTDLGWNPRWQPYPYDPQRAKELLAQAGYPNGFELKLLLVKRPGIPDLPTMGEAVANYWEKIGIRVKMEPADYSARVRADIRDRKMAYTFTHSNGPHMIHNLWWMQYAPSYTYTFLDGYPEMIPIMERARQATDPKVREEYLWAAGNIIMDNYMAVPLAWVNAVFAVSSKVGDWPLTANNGGPINYNFITPPGY